MTRIAQALVLTIALTASAQPGPTTFEYWGWPLDHYRIELPHAGKSGQVVFGGDSFAQAEFCTPDSTFHCFRAHRLWFAVPRALREDQDEWTHHQIRYEVRTRGLTIKLLGRSFQDVMYIRSPHYAIEDKFFEWLYSPSRGLLAFILVDRHGGHVWTAHWLQGEEGFGAQ